MGYKRRRRSVDLRRASLPTLQVKLAEAEALVSSLEASLAKARANRRLAPAQLKDIDARLAALESTIAKLRALRVPKRGLLGNLFGLTELPGTVRSQMAAVDKERTDLHNRKWELERLVRSIESYEGSLERARSWLSKIQEAVSRKLRKRDAFIELRAAAAATANAARQVGVTVKRKLPRQPWCPYCGGPLGTDPHADHIYPISKGGRSVPRNMVYVCAGCNSMKKNLTLAGFIRKYSLDRTAIERRLEELHKEF